MKPGENKNRFASAILSGLITVIIAMPVMAAQQQAAEDISDNDQQAPEARFAGKNGGQIYKGLLLAQVGVFVTDNDTDIKYEVVSFMVVTAWHGDTLKLKSHGAQITGEQKDLFMKLQEGNSFRIDSIMAMGQDGRKIQLPSMTFWITLNPD